MFSTDNLFFLVLILIPASVFLIFNRHIRLVPYIEKDGVIRAASTLLFSFAVFAINSLLLTCQYSKFVAQKTIFDDTWLLTEIVAVNIVVSFVASWLFLPIDKYIISGIINLVNIILKRPSEITGIKTTWNEIFETKQLLDVGDTCVVTIEKDGITSSGIVMRYSSPTNENKAFLLTHCDLVEGFLKKDKFLHDDEKMFPAISFEYIDITTGFKIIFYDNSNYKSWLKQAEQK